MSSGSLLRKAENEAHSEGYDQEDVLWSNAVGAIKLSLALLTEEEHNLKILVKFQFESFRAVYFV